MNRFLTLLPGRAALLACCPQIDSPCVSAAFNPAQHDHAVAHAPLLALPLSPNPQPLEEGQAAAPVGACRTHARALLVVVVFSRRGRRAPHGRRPALPLAVAGVALRLRRARLGRRDEAPAAVVGPWPWLARRWSDHAASEEL